MSTDLYHLSARVPHELHAGLKMKSAVTGRTVQTLVAEALAAYLAPQSSPDTDVPTALADLSWLADHRHTATGANDADTVVTAQPTTMTSSDDLGTPALPFETDDTYAPSPVALTVPPQPSAPADTANPIPVTSHANDLVTVTTDPSAAVSTVSTPTGEFIVELRFRPAVAS